MLKKYEKNDMVSNGLVGYKYKMKGFYNILV